MNSEKQPTLEQIEAILKGIDRCEVQEEDGWWETSEGAAFGSKKLEELRALFGR